MGIKVGESNKTFRYATNFDMVSNTALSLKFTPPSGVSFVIDSSGGRVTMWFDPENGAHAILGFMMLGLSCLGVVWLSDQWSARRYRKRCTMILKAIRDAGEQMDERRRKQEDHEHQDR